MAKRGPRGDRISAANYIALAGEFSVLAALARGRLEATLTRGHTKGIDILVLDRRTGRTYKVEVKTTEKAIEQSRLFFNPRSKLA
jgi:hypothetical protein